MKILVVVPSLGGGGAERVVSLLTREWSRDHQVVLALLDGGQRAYEAGGRVVDLGCPAGGGLTGRFGVFLRRWRRLRGLLQAEAPDRIVSFMETASIPTVLAAAATGRLGSLVASVRNNPSGFPWYHRAAIRLLYRRVPRVVAVSRGVADALQRSAGLRSDRVVAIPNPVDGAMVERLSRGPLPEGLDLPRDFILAAGRLVPQKGFGLLLEAFARLGEAARGVSLVILGEGPLRDELQQQAERLGLADRLLMPGYVENPFAVMRAARLFVLSSGWEGWPNALVEAMACGQGVVATDCPYGPGEIVRHGETGFLVPVGDPEQMAEVLAHALREPDRVRRMGSQAAEAVQSLDVPATARRWLDLMRALPSRPAA